MEILKTDEKKFIVIPESDIIGDKIITLQQKLNSIINEAELIDLNMRNVHYAVSSIVPVIMEATKKLSDKGGKLVLKNCNDRIKDLIETLGKGSINIDENQRS